MRQRVPIIITSLRPPAEVVCAVHGYGGIVLHDVISIRHADCALPKVLSTEVRVLAAVAGA